MTVLCAPVRRLLIVDDMESNRYILTTWLRRAGYDVVEAQTGREALDHIAAQPFDLILLDVNLPDMSGYEVCEIIKAAPETAAIPVLHVSATATETTDRSQGLRRGAEGYLVEPVEREELLATVEALLRASISHQTSIRLARKLRTLNEATLAVNEPQTLEALVATIAHQAFLLFGETAIAAVSVDGEGFIAVGRHSEEPIVRAVGHRTVHALGDALPANGIAASALARPFLPDGVELAAAEVAVADLGTTKDHRGVLLVARDQPSDDDENDVVLAQFARGSGAAIRSVLVHDVERRIALTLQRGLLPESVPPISGFDVAVRYQAGTTHAEVGGDFYEIFTLGDRAMLAIGDVMGHSLEAATVMAQLRTAFRSYALEGNTPENILERLNRLLLLFHPDTTATVCCGWIDVRTGASRLANAGHPPPLVVAASGAHFLKFGGPLLGVPEAAAGATDFTLGPGDTIVLYTDGLIERRHETIESGLARLAAIAADRHSDLDGLCDRLLGMVDAAKLDDDVALMAIRRLT